VLTHFGEWKDTFTDCTKPTGELHVAYLSQVGQSCHRLLMYFQNSINWSFITVTAIYSVQCLRILNSQKLVDNIALEVHQ
jgi:hypothetical protein